MPEAKNNNTTDLNSGLFSIGDSPFRGLILASVLPSTGTINQIAWSFDGKLIAGTLSDGKICVWETEKDSVIANLDGHVGESLSLSWSSAETKLVTGGKGYLVR